MSKHDHFIAVWLATGAIYFGLEVLSFCMKQQRASPILRAWAWLILSWFLVVEMLGRYGSDNTFWVHVFWTTMYVLSILLFGYLIRNIFIVHANYGGIESEN